METAQIGSHGYSQESDRCVASILAGPVHNIMFSSVYCAIYCLFSAERKNYNDPTIA